MIDLVLLLCILLISLTLGEKLLDRFKIEAESYLERVPFSIGLGLGILSFSVYAIGLVGLLYKPLLWMVVILLSLWLFPNFRPHFSKIYYQLRGAIEKCRGRARPTLYDELAQSTTGYSNTEPICSINIFSGLLLVLLLLHLVGDLFGALAPEVVFDALWYHLALPKIYLTNHKIFFVPYIALSGYPRLIEMLYMLGLALTGETLAKLIHFTLGVLTGVSIFLIGRKFFDSQMGLWAATIFYAMQPVNMLSATAYIDLGLTYFGLLALFALLNGFSSRDYKWIALSGCFAGLAMGAKYQGGFIASALGLSWLVLTSCSKDFSFKKATGNLLIFTLMACFVFLPWAIDNFLRTGNPIYPIFNKLFGLEGSWEEIDIASHRVGSWFEGHSLLGFITLPWKLTMGSCDGWVSPLILFFVPLSLFILGIDWYRSLILPRLKSGGILLTRCHTELENSVYLEKEIHSKSEAKQWVFLFLILFSFSLYVLLFLLPYWIVRFFVPLFPALSLLAAYTWQKLGAFDKFVDKSLKVIVVLVVLANLCSLVFKNIAVVPVSLGLESRENYLNRTLGWYSVNRYIRDKISSKDIVLVYGAQLFYHFDFDYLYELPIRESAPDKLMKELKKKRISHILLLVDKGGPQNLWEIRGFEKIKGLPYIRLVYEKDMPEPARTNAARGAKLYEIL